MTEKRQQLGTILLESGRITPDDVQRVLEYQRAHGGFFGQGLVALEIVSREEIDWALASQFDLPFIFPNADAVDREAARMVPADWALAHMAVPIVKAGKSLTVVVADPLRQQLIEELRARTGCEIELALASATRIRELIHAVYDEGDTRRTAEVEPVPFEEFVRRALDQGAERFGLSVRGDACVAWWTARKETHRTPLESGWEGELAAMVRPSPLELLETGGELSATLHHDDSDVDLDARALPGAGGGELLFRTVRAAGEAPPAFRVSLPPSLVTELRLLWKGGSARIGVSSAQLDAARAVLPRLPSLALGAHVRAAHVNDGGDAGGAYTLRAAPGEDFAESVAEYRFDALTVDLPLQGYAVAELLQAAPLTFMLLSEPAERAAPADWGVNWLLTIIGGPGNFAWDLRALHR